MAEPKVLTDIRNLQTGLSSHTTDTNIHVTTTEKNKWNDYETKFKPQITVQQITEVALNTTLEPLVLATIGGQFWYVETEFWTSKNAGSNRVQMAKRYSGAGDVMVRNYYNGVWSAWSPSMQSVFSDVSNGKSSIASALTDKGQTTDATASFDVMATAIMNINEGMKKAGGTAWTNQSGHLLIPAGTFDFTPKIIYTYKHYIGGEQGEYHTYATANYIDLTTVRFGVSYTASGARQEVVRYWNIGATVYNGGFEILTRPGYGDQPDLSSWVALG